MSGITPEQTVRLASLLDRVEKFSPFYQRKWAGCSPSVQTFQSLPFTCKADLVADQLEHPPYGSGLLEPLENYTRLHQTSGTTTGKPLRWLDTPTSWNWMLDCWTLHFQKLGITRKDRLYFPFSFGPFLGFWTAFEHASRNGYFVLPGGGMSTPARLKMLLEHSITVLFATPTYALHLAEVAETEQLNLRESKIRAIVVAGEPGGAIPGTRQRLEDAWGAKVFDHYGLTEVGPLATESGDNSLSLEVLDQHYLTEVIQPHGTKPVPEGEVGELVVTNLGRVASPLIRYRTGDLVRAKKTWSGTVLVGGVLGRTDEMLHIRGNNVYPTAIEAIIRRFAGVSEFRIIVDKTGPLTELSIEVEQAGHPVAVAIAEAIREELLFRADVREVPVGSLPRFEMKARRVITRPK